MQICISLRRKIPKSAPTSIATEENAVQAVKDLNSNKQNTTNEPKKTNLENITQNDDAELRPNICEYGLAYPTGLPSLFFFFLWGAHPAFVAGHASSLWDESLLLSQTWVLSVSLSAPIHLRAARS